LLLCGLLLAVSGSLWWASHADGRTHLIVPTLPGDGLLIKSPRGQFALVDGGADGAAVANWLGQELPLGRRTIDLLVATRADNTTLPGQLAAARRYHIQRAVLVEPHASDPAWDELVRLMRAQGTVVTLAHGGERFSLDGADQQAIAWRVLAVNAGRATLELTAGRQRVLLLQSLGNEPIPAGVARVPAAAILYPWRRDPRDPALAALAPRVVIFSEQPGAAPQLTMAERAIGTARLLHEALDGRIELVFDSSGIQVNVERQNAQ
jgi:hypothetical protein